MRRRNPYLSTHPYQSTEDGNVTGTGRFLFSRRVRNGYGKILEINGRNADVKILVYKFWCVNVTGNDFFQEKGTGTGNVTEQGWNFILKSDIQVGGDAWYPEGWFIGAAYRDD